MATALAAVTWAVSFSLLLMVMLRWIAPLWSLPAGVLMMLGFVLSVPPILGPLARLINRWALQWIWPAEGELAERQIFRNHTRVVLTTAVLVVALGNGVGLGHAILNSVADVRAWCGRIMSADVVVTPANPQRAAEFSLKTRDTMEARIESVVGVQQAETVRFMPAQVRGLPAVAIAREFSESQPLPWETAGLDEATVREKLARGQVVIGSALANRANLRQDDTVRIEVAGASAEFRIAAVTPDYVAGGLSVYLHRDAAQKELGIDGVDLFLLKLSKTGRARDRRPLGSILLRQRARHAIFFRVARTWTASWAAWSRPAGSC